MFMTTIFMMMMMMMMMYSVICDMASEIEETVEHQPYDTP